MTQGRSITHSVAIEILIVCEGGFTRLVRYLSGYKYDFLSSRP